MGCSILSTYLGFYNYLFGQDFVKSNTVILKSIYHFIEFTTIIWNINEDISGNTDRQLISTIDVKDSIGFVSHQFFPNKNCTNTKCVFATAGIISLLVDLKSVIVKP